MSNTSTLSINVVTQDGSATESVSHEEITVTHLAARTLAPKDGGPARHVSPGLVIVIPGEDSIELKVDDEPVRLSSGMALVVSGAARIIMPATVGESSDAAPASLRIIELNARFSEAGPLRNLLELPMLLTAEHAHAANSIFEQLTIGSASSPLPAFGINILPHLTAIGLASTLLMAAGEQSENQTTPQRGKRVTQLREFLFKNLDHSITTVDMARHVGMSRTLFFRWAKQALGGSPLQYLRALRLERCQEWIAQDAAPLEQIASQTGFTDASHLGRAFKKHFGMTPAQYRKTVRSTAGAELLASAAERYFRQGRFDEALAACEQGLRATPPATLIERLRYQKGLCLRALGRAQDAITEWQALRISGFSHRAGIQECRQLFLADDPVNARELLRALYDRANAFEREDVLSLWIDQVNALAKAKRPHPLRAYLNFRKQHFPHDMRSITSAVNALRMLGENLEVLEQCTDLPVACYHALRRAGKYDDAVARYGARIPSHAVVEGAYFQGRYEDVLAMEQVRPGLMVGALVELGRAGEAIERYPEHSAPAFLALRRYEELLERFPPISRNDESRTAALLALGRTQEVEDLLTDSAGGWNFSPLLLYLRPDAVLEIRHPEAHPYTNEARVLIVINALLAGNTPEAREALEQLQGIRSPDFWWYDHSGTELLVVAILRNMLGFPAGVHDDLEEIITNHKYKDKQALWHDAAYLSGKISAVEFRRQPQQRRIEERQNFIRAAAHDLKGHHSAARKAYEDVLAAPQRSFESQAFMRQRFATWRLQEL